VLNTQRHSRVTAQRHRGWPVFLEKFETTLVEVKAEVKPFEELTARIIDQISQKGKAGFGDAPSKAKDGCPALALYCD
jgi:hypothetical protein